MTNITDAQAADARRRLDELFPSKFSHTMFQLEYYAGTHQKFDVSFYQREPILDVCLERDFAHELLAVLNRPHMLMRRPGARRLSALLKRIVFSDGATAHIDDIWTINHMPPDRLTIAALDSADLAQAEVRAGYGGETIREMLRETYRCASAAEEDWFVRRWIAS